MYSNFLSRFEGKASRVTKKGPKDLEEFDIATLHSALLPDRNSLYRKPSQHQILSKKSLYSVSRKVTEPPFNQNNPNRFDSLFKRRSLVVDPNQSTRRMQGKLDPLPLRLFSLEGNADSSENNEVKRIPSTNHEANNYSKTQERAKGLVHVQLDRQMLDALTRISKFQNNYQNKNSSQRIQDFR